jgi:hypothetical protein
MFPRQHVCHKLLPARPQTLAHEHVDHFYEVAQSWQGRGPAAQMQWLQLLVLILLHMQQPNLQSTFVTTRWNHARLDFKDYRHCGPAPHAALYLGRVH